MRETCARVLAAALMTGAIGFAIGMPAIVGTAHDAGRSLTAPPSFLQRSVHVVASAPTRSGRGGRLEQTQPIRAASFLEGGGTPASSRHSTKAGRSERAPKPTPAPPTPPTRELASTTPQAEVSSSTPSQPAATPDTKGKGKKKGHNKNKGKPIEVSQPPVATTTPVPASEPPATEAEKDHGNGNGNDNGKAKGKSDGKGHNG
jgi:hypothetical protein